MSTISDTEVLARDRPTAKQMGDAGEMLVAAELTLAGVPALKAPDSWPGYDVIAQPRDGSKPLRISVKSRTFKRGSAYVDYWVTDVFDWLAIVILPASTEPKRRFFLIPRMLDSPTAKTAAQRYWRIDEIARLFPLFESNFTLNPSGTEPPCACRVGTHKSAQSPVKASGGFPVSAES
jgi:hypothetical protein